VRPNQYLTDLMKPIMNARELPEGDFKGLERNMELLLHTFERAREANMLDMVLHVSTLQQMFEKWPRSEKVRWWRIASEVPPSEQPQRFMGFVQRQYPQVAMLAGQSALSSGSDSGRQGGGSGQESKNKKKPPKVTVNAAQAATPAAPPQPQRQQQPQPQRQQQQVQRGGWNKGYANNPRPCRLADKGCKEAHRLDNCGVFGRMSAEQKLAVLQEKQLCLYCYKHLSSQECFAKNDAGYKGCGFNGCKDPHSEELHYVTTTARLFSVHAQPADPQPGAQIFTLRQNIKDGCNVAFDSGSDRTAVTEEYARRRGLQRLGCSTSAMGLGQTAATSGGMYVVEICDKWGNMHRLEAMAVPHIYTGPAARCPKNLRKRFLRTYTPLSGELHQTGAATDVCIGADYPHLQPKHIEQEMGGGPLHIYQSIFGKGFIL